MPERQLSLGQRTLGNYGDESTDEETECDEEGEDQ